MTRLRVSYLCTVRFRALFFLFLANRPPSSTHKMTHDDRLRKELAELESYSKRNDSALAKSAYWFCLRCLDVLHAKPLPERTSTPTVSNALPTPKNESYSSKPVVLPNGGDPSNKLDVQKLCRRDNLARCGNELRGLVVTASLK
jgi:hypothetical protein